MKNNTQKPTNFTMTIIKRPITKQNSILFRKLTIKAEEQYQMSRHTDMYNQNKYQLHTIKAINATNK